MLHFLKTWTLPIAMLAGAAAYFLYISIPVFDGTHRIVGQLIGWVQPVLIFLMLFLSFCKVDPLALRPRRWHALHLLVQSGSFASLCLLCTQLPSAGLRVVVEAAMLCMICPTATAAVVVTGKLGGDTAGLTTYTLLINLATAIVVPLLVPLVHPSASVGFLVSFQLIIARIFPLLICPFVLAVLVRYLLPKLHKALLRPRDLPFYLWAVSLSLAIGVSVRSLFHSHATLWVQLGIALASLLSCVLQFGLGRWLGKRYGCPISAAQALGQKNTVFAIWVGYTFLTPVSALAGGFYSIWHNVYNTWQLRRQEQEKGPC